MPGSQFTNNQRSEFTGGFTPVTSFNPNRIMVTNQYGYATASDLTIADLQASLGVVNFIFNDISSLRSLNNILIISLLKAANVLGYYDKTDGAGGTFVWDSTSTEADNGGTIIKPTGIAEGRWKRVMDKAPVNVRIFGAKGDGVTDDTASIMNAAAYCNSFPSAGATLYFPQNVGYQCSQTVSLGTGIGLLMDGILNYTGPMDRPAIACGAAGGATSISNQISYRVMVNNATTLTSGNSWLDENFIGVKFTNSYNCNIQIIRSSFFTIGVQCIGDGYGFAYNNVFLNNIANNKFGLDLNNNLVGVTQGWCNENNFYGGRFSVAGAAFSGKDRTGVRLTSKQSYNNNNNIFYKPAFELGQSSAGGGIALPILIERGVLNTFHDCRGESVNIVFVRTENTSENNRVEIGYSDGSTGQVQDNGTLPSTLVSQRRLQTMDGYFNTIYNSGYLTKKLTPYNNTEYYIADELFFGSSSNASILEHRTITSITNDYVEISSAASIGVRVNTRLNKRFVIKRDCDIVSGNNGYGRVFIRCYDAAGTILSGSTPFYARSFGSTQFIASTAHGGGYLTPVDSGLNTYVSLDPAVQYIDVLFTGGSNNVRLRSFQIQCINTYDGATTSGNGYSSIIKLNNKTGRYAIQAPISGTWAVGDIINNYNPSPTSVTGWRCTAAGSPGTWSDINISAPTLQDVTNQGANTTLSIQTGGIVSTGGMSMPYRSVTATGNILATDYLILGNNTTAIDLTLPAPASVPGKIIVVKKISNNGFGVKVITPSGTIDGATDFTLSTLNESKRIQASATNWYVI